MHAQQLRGCQTTGPRSGAPNPLPSLVRLAVARGVAGLQHNALCSNQSVSARKGATIT